MVELLIPSVSDAARIAAVLNARSRALSGVTEENTEGVAGWFSIPDLDPASDMRLAVGRDGSPLGYADVSGPEDDPTKAWVDLRVPPANDEALAPLFEWAQARAQARVGAGGSIRVFADEQDAALRDRLAAEGYAVVRSSYRMERALDGALDEPEWPPGLSPRAFEAGDALRVHAADVEAFADHWDSSPESFEHWSAHHLGPEEDTSLWRLVEDGEELAGICINRPSRGEDMDVGWIRVLAVRRPWRRRGLGEALLRDAFRTFAACGKHAVGLGVDSENLTGAVALYERVGMRVVRRSDTWARTV